MKRYTVHPSDPYAGLFSDLFILGTTRGAAGVSDFTAGATTQNFALLTPGNGDCVTYPLAQAFTKIGFAGGALSSVLLDVGFTNGSTFMLDQQMITLGAGGVSPLISGVGGPKNFDGVIGLTATIDTVGANLSAITAGEIFIYVTLCRAVEFSTKLYG